MSRRREIPLTRAMRVGLATATILGLGLMNVAMVLAAETGVQPPIGTERNTAATTAQPMAPVNVSIQDFSFNPVDLTVQIGTKVVWMNSGPATHTATSNRWDTGSLKMGESAYWVFDSAGTYPYSCTIHPQMRGTVTVTGMGSMPGAMGPMPSGGMADSPIISQWQQMRTGTYDMYNSGYIRGVTNYSNGPYSSYYGGNSPYNWAFSPYASYYPASYNYYSPYSSLYGGYGFPYLGSYGYGSGYSPYGGYSGSMYYYGGLNYLSSSIYGSYTYNPYTYYNSPAYYSYLTPYGGYGGYGTYPYYTNSIYSYYTTPTYAGGIYSNPNSYLGYYNPFSYGANSGYPYGNPFSIYGYYGSGSPWYSYGYGRYFPYYPYIY